MMKRLMIGLVMVLIAVLIGVAMLAQVDDALNPRAQDGVWIVAPTTWETVGETLLLDDADTQHTIQGTFYRVEHDGVLYITCAVGRGDDGRMRLELRNGLNGEC